MSRTFANAANAHSNANSSEKESLQSLSGSRQWNDWSATVNWRTIPHSSITLSLSLSLSLSFRLWILQVRGHPHGFFFSIQLDALHPPRWAAGPPCCAWRRRSISFSVFLCSVVHLHLPPRSAWHSRPLLAVVRAHTISAWPPVPYPWYTLLQGCDGSYHFFSCPSR